MNRTRAIRLSKLLSLALRHEPSVLGLSLDAGGWVDIEAVLRGLAAKAELVTYEELEAMVASSDKQRFALSANGEKIRANQGHSVSVDLGLVPRQPPPVLFHGTVDRFHESILRSGIVSGARTHVHLSSDEETAQTVARRRAGTPIILRIRALELHGAGGIFFVSENGVWLTPHVPPTFIEPHQAS